MSFALGVRTNIYNGKLRELRKDYGITQLELDNIIGMTIGQTSRIETFKDYPDLNKLEEIAMFFNSTVDELFPEWLREQSLKRSSYETTVLVERLTLDSPEVLMLQDPDASVDVEKEFTNKELYKLLECLTDRERIIIERRFGLNGYEPMSHEKVGKEFGVSRERVRQIEARTLSKLRKHKNSKILGEMYNGK